MRYKEFLRYDMHVHSSLCGGKDTHEQFVRAAIDRGMRTIGFSEHSRVSALGLGMTEDDERYYREEIDRLREKYGNQIRILRGIEQDFYSDLPPLGYDYVIGSVHFLRVNGEYCRVDGSEEEMQEVIRQYFRGDVFAFLRLYFQTVSELPRKTACDVIGHFDLIANTCKNFFDTSDHFYLGYAIKAIQRLVDENVIFEVNTKAFFDSEYRMFHPSTVLLNYILGCGGRILFSSDSISNGELTRGFFGAATVCRSMGVGSFEILTEKGWEKSFI